MTSLLVSSFPVPPIALAAPTVRVSLIIERLEDLDGIDDFDDPEFYALVSINGGDFVQQGPPEDEDRLLFPNWRFSADVDYATTTSVPITIEIWDDDSFVTGGDDWVDIDPTGGRALNLSVNLAPCAITGDTSGRCQETLVVQGTEENHARMDFRVEVQFSNSPGLKISCLHNPIWPQGGDAVTITAETFDNTFAANPADIEIYVNNQTTATINGTGVTTLASALTAPAAGSTFFYGCLARDGADIAWSGWKVAHVGIPSIGRAVPIVYTGPRENRIDIVFMPDADTYAGVNDAQFLADIEDLLQQVFHREGFVLENQARLNFWLARDPGDTDGTLTDCTNLSPPANWDADYSFADSGAIVHNDPHRDCASSSSRIFGGEIERDATTGALIATAAGARVFLHEMGHSPFGLADEYPPDGGYFETAEFPNVYDNLIDCQSDPLATFPDSCQVISTTTTLPATTWYRLDRSSFTSDLMLSNGEPQQADLRRIRWLFDQVASGSAQALTDTQLGTLSASLAQVGGPNDPVPALDLNDPTKALFVRLAFNQQEQVSLDASGMFIGKSHTRRGDPPLLRVRLLDVQSTLLEEYNAWDPRWQFLEQADGTEGMVINPDSVGRFILPFYPRLKFMELWDARTNEFLTRVDLENAAVRGFCEQTPNDSDCLNYPFSKRVTKDLVSLYTLDEGIGAIINDVAGTNKPLNLVIADPGAVQWTTGGLTILRPTSIQSREPATKLLTAAQQNNEITIEGWINPANINQAGPARIATFSSSATLSNFTLGQGRFGNQPSDLYDVRLRTTDTSADGRPSLVTPAGILTTELTHVLYTRDRNGVAKVYINGELKATRTVGGDFSNWDSTAHLALAAEVDRSLPWLGEYQLVAFYGRALTEAEVQQNYDAGPSGYDEPPTSRLNEDLYGYDYEIWTNPAAPRAESTIELGTIIHRDGGKAVLNDVKVRFFDGDPEQGGSEIGEATVDRLSPRWYAISSGVDWVPAVPGVYTIYAVIDPDDVIPEDNEGNNVLRRRITVLEPAVDSVAPRVERFTIDDGAIETEDPSVTLEAVASDPEPGSGVADLLFIEYEYRNDVGDWTPVQNSGWLPYDAEPLIREWTMTLPSGIRYFQAWARDGAGNISHYPYWSTINYLPPVAGVQKDEVRVYRYNLNVGDKMTVRLEPISGDPDLYIWAPDSDDGRSPWVSNLRNAVDEITLVAPVTGEYQIEVFGYTAATYRLIIDIATAQAAPQAALADEHGGIDPTKAMLYAPLVPVGSRPPATFLGLIEPAVSSRIYLPMVRR